MPIPCKPYGLGLRRERAVRQQRMQRAAATTNSSSPQKTTPLLPGPISHTPPPDSPSAYCFGLFDRLLVLMGGRTIYFGGSGRQVIEYFTRHCGAREPQVGDNLAEWLMVSGGCCIVGGAAAGGVWW
jgi:hypothetical protein